MQRRCVIVAVETMPKMLSLFAAMLPAKATVAVLADASSNVHPHMWRTLQQLATRLNPGLLQVQVGRKPGQSSLPEVFEPGRRQLHRQGGPGVQPGNIPVAQPTVFELVVNLKTAKALGITIPRDVLLSANSVIQ